MPPFYYIYKQWRKLLATIAMTAIVTSLCGQSPITKPTTSLSNNASVGWLAWSNLGNGISPNNAYISCGALLGVLASAQTNYILASGFGFEIPNDPTITAIEARVERNAAGLLIGSSITDKNVFIIKKRLNCRL